MALTKKRKIVVAIGLITILVVGVIASILLITRRKFDITDETFEYNNHKEMFISSKPANLTTINTGIGNNTRPKYYSNGCVIVNTDGTVGYGVYSFVDNELIIPTDYDLTDITPINVADSDEEDEFVFHIENTDNSDQHTITLYDDEGEKLDMVWHDSNSNTNYAHIMKKQLNLKETRSGKVKVNTKNKFTETAIAIEGISFVDSYQGEDYHYELWELTGTDGATYTNLYEVDDEERELIQTIDNHIGSSIEASNTGVVVLSDGTPRLLNTTISYNDGETQVMQMSVFDTKFREKGTASINTDDTTQTPIKIGDNLYIQYVIPTTEKKYDFAEIDSNGNSLYFRLETYKLNLKNGKFKDVDLDYILDTDSAYKTIGNSVVVTGRKIENKALSNPNNLLINEDLKIKELPYNINKITKITKKRFVVEANNGQYLVDDDYDIVSFLGNNISYFTTSESIILNNSNTNLSYVVDLDGVVVTQGTIYSFTDLHDSKYYMVKVEESGNAYYYLERLGVRKSLVYAELTDSTETYTYANKSYLRCDLGVLSDGLSIITQVRVNGEGYAYDFYNVEGQLLLTLNGFETSNRPLKYWGYKDEDHAILQIGTNIAGEEYFLVVDR
ncbi:MAG: hypothetical protein E7356_04570 [Clostridiales bacterium]|nr:hypothetical protein [Clostridiales bacterium]